MALNAIEIIFDSSESMKNNIFLSTTNKLTISKDILIEILSKSNIDECEHILNIVYFKNNEIVKLEDIKDIDKIEPDGKKLLHEAVERAIDNLKKVDKKYQKKIIILSDGKSSSYEKKESIVHKIKKQSSKIKVYTVTIDDISDTKDIDIEYIAKETKGKNYLYDNIEGLHSILKKDFECKKSSLKAIVIIPFLFFSLIATVLYIKSYSVNPTKVESSSIIAISNFPPIKELSKKELPPPSKELPPISKELSPPPKEHLDKEKPLTTKLFSLIKKEEIKTNSEITHCEKKIVNGIKLNKCTFLKNKKFIIFHYNNGDNREVIGFQNFSTGKSASQKDTKIFVEDVFRIAQIDSVKRIKKIEIIGHTDLERVNKNKNFDFYNYCLSRKIKTNSNECLGEIRAMKVKRFIDKIYKVDDISYRYDDDFFMSKVNNNLNKTLWRALDIKNSVNMLMKKLNIIKGYRTTDIRKDREIQNTIVNNDSVYSNDLFKPFRSIIVIVTTK